MTLTLAGVLLYVVAQLAIGVWAARRISTEEDYLVAGRKLGYGLGIFTVFATWFGAETCIGAAGRIYEHGLSGGSADPFGYALCILLMGAIFAVPLWRRKLTTIADLFRQRYSAGVERLAVLLMVPTSLLWAAAQIRAFGQVLSVSSTLEVDVAIGIAAAVVIIYTMSGGLMADAITDVVQGVALIVGLLVVFGAVMMDGGAEALQSVDPARLQLFGSEETPLLEVLEAWAIPVFGSVIAAELASRVIAMRSPVVAQRACFAAGGMYLVVGVFPVILGLAGVSLVPGLTDGEQLLPQLALTHLPGALYVLFAGALVSAILSTVDSSLLVSAALVSHNVIVPLRPGMSEREKVRAARIGVVVFGVLAWAMAMYSDGVYALVEQASAFGSAGIVVVVAFGLFTTRGGPASAIAALVAGVAMWVVGSYVLELRWAFIASLVSAIAAYAAVSFVEPRHARRAPTVESVVA
jgi:Na+/proline symporter